MSDAEYIAAVSTMRETELLAAVMENPEYLTDHYYKELGDALRARHQELMETTA